MNHAHIIAEAILLYGQRKITADELAAATGVSRSAAHAVIKNTFARLGDAPGRLDPNRTLRAVIAPTIDLGGAQEDAPPIAGFTPTATSSFPAGALAGPAHPDNASARAGCRSSRLKI